MEPSGGFVYTAMLKFSPAQHARASDVPNCSVNGAADAEFVGTLVVANETPNFSGQPGVSLGPSGDMQISDKDHCSSQATGYGIALRATSPLSQGQSISGPVWLIVPNYYTPNDPYGNKPLLKDQGICAGYEDGNGHTDFSARISVQGPGIGHDVQKNCFDMLGLAAGG